MNEIFNNLGAWLSMFASLVAIISALTGFVAFVRHRRGQSPGQMTLTNTGYIYPPWQESRGIGYHFGCILKTVIIIVLIIALATVLTYALMAFAALILQASQSAPYTSP